MAMTNDPAGPPRCATCGIPLSPADRTCPGCKTPTPWAGSVAVGPPPSISPGQARVVPGAPTVVSRPPRRRRGRSVARVLVALVLVAAAVGGVVAVVRHGQGSSSAGSASGSPYIALNGDRSNGCDFLTAGEASVATGQPLTQLDPGRVDDAASCEYRRADQGTSYLGVQLWAMPAPAGDALSSVMNTERLLNFQPGAPKTTVPLPGLGDQAVAASEAADHAGPQQDVFVRKGPFVVVVAAQRVAVVPDLASEEAVARLVLRHVPPAPTHHDVAPSVGPSRPLDRDGRAVAAYLRANAAGHPWPCCPDPFVFGMPSPGGLQFFFAGPDDAATRAAAVDLCNAASAWVFTDPARSGWTVEVVSEDAPTANQVLASREGATATCG